MNPNKTFLLISLVLLLFLFSLSSTAQTPNEAEKDTSNYPYWVEMMQDTKADFQATVNAFNKYWENRKIEKGSGWKPFKRWESFTRSRLDENGRKPAPDHVLNEYFKVNKGKNLEKTSSTSNANWQEIGPTYLPANGTGQPNGVGRLNGIGFHPTDANTLYVGAPQGGVWKTTDGGFSWSSTTDALPTLGVSAIVVDYDNPSIVYIGTGDRDAGDAPGLGVWKSTDAGETWFSSNSGMGNRTVGMMIMHPTNPNIILAATNGGIYKTTNGGGNWIQEQGGNFKDIEYKPTDPSIVYASASGSFYRSTNGGDSWTSLGSGQGIPNATRMVLAVTPANPSYVYVLASNSATFKALYLSTNSGASFTTKSNSPNIMDYSTDGSGSSGQAWYDLCLAADPNDETIIYAGGINIFKSTDSGATWTINAHWVGSGGVDDIHADQHALEYSPVNGYLYSGNDGGIYFTDNGGTTWIDRSSGLGIAQVYKIGQSATEKDLVINGYQDNGTAVYDGNWRTEIGGDGMECIIDHSDANYQYGALYYGDMRRSTNNGLNFSRIAANGSNGITESGPWVTPYALHETNPNTMFIGYKNIWRSTNVKTSSASSVAWTKITNINSNIYVVEHSPANTNMLYFVRSGVLYRIDNVMAASPTAVNLDSGLPTSSTPTDIEVHPTDENIVYMTMSNNVYKSTDKGVSWTDISGNIPNISTNCLVYQVGLDEGLYVGTDAGVYFKDNTLNDWVEFDENLPVNSEITELEIYYDDNICNSRIRASTYGRGLWESQLQNVDEYPPLADFRAGNTEICEGSSIQFENLSGCIPNTYQWAFTPNSITYLNNTNSTSSNPEVQFNTSGNYTVSLTVTSSQGSDTQTFNNYISVSNSFNLPPSADFENVAACSTANNCSGTNCNLNLSNSWFNETNGSGDNIDWRVDSDGTPSVDTGPSIDHTVGTSAGMYLYLEASNGCTNQTAHLSTPCIDIPLGTTELRFWYHLYGASIGSLHIDVLESEGWQLNFSPAIVGNQGNTWLEKVVDISEYAGETIKLRIRGTTGSGWSSDIAIDDISIENTPPTTITANFTANTTEGCEGTSINFTDTSIGNPTDWAWTFTGGTPASSNLQNPTITYNSAGTYAVSLTASNAQGDNTLVKNSYITIFATPTADINGDLSICGTESTTLTALGGTSYIWSTGDDTNPITVTPTQNTTYTVTTTDANGCTDSHEVAVTVNSSFDVSITADLEICEGENTRLSTNDGTIYSWSTGSTDPRTVVSPTENTVYSVTVTNEDDCTGTAQATVTVNEAITADISGDLEICGSGGTTLTASGGSSYTWSNSHSTNTIYVTPTANTVYTVTVTSDLDCTDIKQVSVTVLEELNPNINGDLEICNGENTTLTASGGNNYSWSTGASTNQITVTPTENTIYTVTVSDNGECPTTEEVTVLVNANPTANITGNLTICEGESTTLTASGGTSFNWNTGDDTQQITVNPAQNTNYDVEVTDANGCSDTHQVTVVVNPNPTANIAGNLTICEGESTTLTASGGISFAWNTGDDTNQITVNPAQNTNYDVEVTDANGCSDTHQVTVVVNPNPTANITGNLTICEGESTTLTASGGTSFAWNIGDDTNQITVNPTQNTNYNIEVTDANGCTDTHQVTVVVNPNPTANITGNLTICEGESTTLTASGGTSFNWNTGSDDTNQITVNPTQNTNYDVEVTDANGCTDTHQVAVTVNTGENCCETVVSIEYENTNDLPVCVTADDYIKAGNYGLGNTIVSNVQEVQFTAGNYISLDPGFLVESGGVFDAQVTGSSAPSINVNETEALNKTELTTNTLSNENTQLLIFPNPFTTRTTANYRLFEAAEVSLSVYDLAGKKVELLIDHQIQKEGTYKVSFDSCNLKQGIYLCVLEIDGEKRISKLLKQ